MWALWAAFHSSYPTPPPRPCCLLWRIWFFSRYPIMWIWCDMVKYIATDAGQTYQAMVGSQISGCIGRNYFLSSVHLATCVRVPESSLLSQLVLFCYFSVIVYFLAASSASVLGWSRGMNLSAMLSLLAQRFCDVSQKRVWVAQLIQNISICALLGPSVVWGALVHGGAINGLRCCWTPVQLAQLYSAISPHGCYPFRSQYEITTNGIWGSQMPRTVFLRAISPRRHRPILSVITWVIPWVFSVHEVHMHVCAGGGWLHFRSLPVEYRKVEVASLVADVVCNTIRPGELLLGWPKPIVYSL